MRNGGQTSTQRGRGKWYNSLPMSKPVVRIVESSRLLDCLWQAKNWHEQCGHCLSHCRVPQTSQGHTCYSWLSGTNPYHPISDWRAWDSGSGKWIYHILLNKNFNRSSAALLSVASCRAVSLEFWNYLNSCISFVLHVNRLARFSSLMR